MPILEKEVNDMSTQYKMVMKKVEQNLYEMRIMPEDYVESGDEEVFASGLSKNQADHFDKLSMKEKKSLIINTITYLKLEEQIKKMNISEIKEHFREITEYIETFDIEDAFKGRNKHKRFKLFRLFDEYDCIKKEIDIRCAEVPIKS